MKNQTIYHYTMGLPKGFDSNVGTVPLRYTRHAVEASQNDKYGPIKLPACLDTAAALCIEVYLQDGAVSKLVYRVTQSGPTDLVFVVVPDGRAFKVLTVWKNLKSDRHETLKSWKYARPAA